MRRVDRFWRLIGRNCEKRWIHTGINRMRGSHQWYDLYGDAINQFNCRSMCTNCRAKSDELMCPPPSQEWMILSGLSEPVYDWNAITGLAVRHKRAFLFLGCHPYTDAFHYRVCANWDFIGTKGP